MLLKLNFVWLVLFVCGACAQNEVSVVTLELEYGQTFTLTVNRSVEFLIEFMPTEQQRQWPSRVSATASAGDVARPVLLTARQRSGAATWQLPYYHEEKLLYEMQRTLCPDDAGGSATCDEESGGGRRGGFSLHVGSTCATPVLMTLRADAAVDFDLAFETDTTYFLTQAAPRVARYRWADGQDRVRLVVSATDDACATVSVQNYTCPIAQTMDVIETRGLRMTVEQSGAVHLSRSSYPYGFLVVGVVRGSAVPCRGEPASEQDWLWEAAVWGERDDSLAVPTTKLINFTVKPALSRAQYAVATAATLALFLVFYLAFGALLLARRWPPLARRVGSLAVLADNDLTEGAQQSQSQLDASGSGAAGTRRRRGSTATFDSSSDDSDTDSEPEPLSRVASPATPSTPATATTAVASPATASPPAPLTPVATPPAPLSPIATPPPSFRDADAAAARVAAAAEAVASTPAATETPRESDGTPGANGHITTEADVQVCFNRISTTPQREPLPL